MLQTHRGDRGPVSRGPVSRALVGVGVGVAACVCGRLLGAQAPAQEQANAPAPLAALEIPVVTAEGPRVSIGMDVTAISSKIVSDLPTVGRQFTLLVPAPRMRVSVDFANRVQLEVPLSLNISHTSGLPTTKDLQIGALGNFYFLNNPLRVQPFVGGGGLYHLQSFGGTYSNSLSQFGAQAQFGLAVPLTANLELRPLLLYQHWFAHSADSLPAENGFGGALGMTWRFNGGSSFVPRVPCSTDLRVGFGIERASYGSYGGTSQPSNTTFSLPFPYLGAFFPIARNGQLAAGATISAQYTSFSGSSAYNIELLPRLEYNFSPDFRTKPGLRFGAQFDLQHEKITSSTTLYGAGADAAFTVPFAKRFNYFAGVGYDYIFKNSSASIPAQNVFSLKLGVDMRPWDK